MLVIFLKSHNLCLSLSKQSVPIEWRNASNAKSQSPRKLDKVRRILWFLLSAMCNKKDIMDLTKQYRFSIIIYVWDKNIPLSNMNVILKMGLFYLLSRANWGTMCFLFFFGCPSVPFSWIWYLRITSSNLVTTVHLDTTEAVYYDIIMFRQHHNSGTEGEIETIFFTFGQILIW